MLKTMIFPAASVAIIFLMGLYCAGLMGEISGLKSKNEMLLSVACRHPKELHEAIVVLATQTKALIPIKQSVGEMVDSYSTGCPEVIGSQDH